MALFKTSLRLAHDVTWPNRRKWSNTFYVDAANPAAAAAAIAGAWTLLFRNAADTTIFAYEAYATDMTPGTDVYATVPIAIGNQRGTRVGESQPYLTKACLAVTLNAVAGRPSRKFWRFGLRETDVENGVSVTSEVATLVRDIFDEALGELSLTFLDPDGQALTSVARITLTTREFGREAGNDVPIPPPVG